MYKPIRKKVSKLLRAFNSYYKLSGSDRINLKDLDAFFRYISSHDNESNNSIDDSYGEQIYLIVLLLTVFGSLALLLEDIASSKDGHDNTILKSNFSARDIHLCGFLTNICNTASAALSLIKKGYDTQSRVLVRSMEERIYQCIVLFACSEDYAEWDRAEKMVDAKATHYKLFAKKGRLLNKMRVLEKKYLKVSDHDNTLKAWRKENQAYYSMAVHGSNTAVMVGSSSGSLHDDELVCFPNLFGVVSNYSEATLEHIISLLHTLLMMLPKILADVHQWTPKCETDFERLYVASLGLACKFVGDWILRKYE